MRHQERHVLDAVCIEFHGVGAMTRGQKDCASAATCSNAPSAAQCMSTPEAEAVDERLAIFEDEADINDWIESCAARPWCCSACSMFSPGDLVDPTPCDGLPPPSLPLDWWDRSWPEGHGRKDLRRSMVMMDLSGAGEPDHGLIRDVLLNPEAYRDFLLDAYREAWEDGITEDEMEELFLPKRPGLRRRDGGDAQEAKDAAPIPGVKVAEHPLIKAFRL